VTLITHIDQNHRLYVVFPTSLTVLIDTFADHPLNV